jgi:hypothetical protein
MKPWVARSIRARGWLAPCGKTLRHRVCFHFNPQTRLIHSSLQHMCGRRGSNPSLWIQMWTIWPARAPTAPRVTRSMMFPLSHYVANSNPKSKSSNLANQLGIHLILPKREKSTSNILTNQLGKNRNLAKLTSPRVYAHADRGCYRPFPLGGRVKKKNREGFLM